MELGQAPAKAPAPAQTDASQTNGRPNSQLADSLTDQPHSQDLQRPNGAPVSRQRVAEEPSLTVIRPGHPAPTTESGSNSGTENEESDAMEESSGGDSRSDGGHALPRRPPPHTPTGPANSRAGFAPRNDLRTSPSEPRRKIYRASSLRECKDLIADLETQFSDKPQSYKLNVHKIQLGETYLSDSQLERWKLQRREFIEPSWTLFRLLLAELIADIVPAEVARSKYTDSSQGKGETVLNYALYLQTFAPHFNSAHHNRLRHLWDRVNSELKGMADRNWEGFQTYHQFLDFLIKIEDSLPSRSRPGDFRPRKRRRSNS